MRWRTLARWLALGLNLLLLAAVTAYPLADWLRHPLDAAARQTLLREGKAQKFVQVPQGVMHVRETGPGNGPVVLLIHGGVIGGYAWQQWQAPLAAAGYRVITPDLLGYGYSDRPSVPHDRRFYVEQLRGLLDALDIRQPVHIVAASLGGAVVASFAADYPDRLRSVTLIAPAGGGAHQDVASALLTPGLGDWTFRLFGASQVRRRMASAYPPSLVRDGLLGWMDEQGHYRGFGEALLNQQRHYDPHWRPADYQALGKSGLPVMVLWGSADTTNAFAQSHQLHVWVPQMRLVPLTGKRHAITFGDAPLLLKHVLPFVGEVRPACQDQGRCGS